MLTQLGEPCQCYLPWHGGFLTKWLSPLKPLPPPQDALVQERLMSAARHTPPNGTILIGLAENADRTIVTLSVDDSGSGISEGLAQEIFQRFSRDPGQTSGSGLGLAIVADIAQVHAGHATLVPTPTPAACSHIEFPIHATAPQG